MMQYEVVETVNGRSVNVIEQGEIIVSVTRETDDDDNSVLVSSINDPEVIAGLGVTVAHAITML